MVRDHCLFLWKSLFLGGGGGGDRGGGKSNPGRGGRNQTRLCGGKLLKRPKQAEGRARQRIKGTGKKEKIEEIR